MIPRLLCFLCLVSRTVSEVSRRCYACQDMTEPSDCKLVSRCDPGYECVLVQFITYEGHVRYNSGCLFKERCPVRKRHIIPLYSSLTRRSDIVTCERCCSGDFCNNEGCGFTVPSRPLRGPMCFTCASENDPKSCRHLQYCNVDEECMLRELPSDTLTGRTTYKSECVSRKVCAAYALIGKRKRKTFCHVCCHDDYCNDRCEELITPAPTTPSTPPTITTLPTTTSTTTKRHTTTTTTTKPPTTHRMTPLELCYHHGYHYDMHSHLCYKFHYEQKTWDQGNSICKQEGGTLAIIDTEAKWNYLRSQLRLDSHYHNQNVYIGGRTKQHGWHIFYWQNGVKVMNAHWAPNEPDGGQDCIYLNGSQDFLWHDMECVNKYKFVCTIQL